LALLLTKLFLAPLCVIGVSMAGRRWGVGVAGMLGGLPVVAGPILLLLTLIHDRGFGAEAAAGSLLGLGGLTAFLVIYARVAPAAGPVLSLLAGWAGFLGVIGIFGVIDPPLGIGLAIVAVGFALGLAAVPSPEPGHESDPPVELPRWDLPARGLAALALVLAVTGASGALGPEWSGLLAPFPIVASVLSTFTHVQAGNAQLLVMTRNFLLGLYGFAAFCFVLALTLDSVAIAPAFALSLAAAVAVQGVSLELRRRGLLGKW
jgi:hypothetical protein